MKKIILTIIAIFFLIGSVLIFWYFLSMNGGLSGWLRNLKPVPDWNSKNITQSRNKVKNEIETSFKEIQNQLNVNTQGSSFYDECVKGEHSWKRNDPYAYECDYKITNFYSFNTDFREKMTELESVLINNGWEANNQDNKKPITKMLSVYYDNLQNTNYGKTKLVSSLPAVDFYNKTGNWARLDIDYAQKETTRLELDIIERGLSNSRHNQIYNKETPIDFKTTFESTTKDSKYFIIISIEKEYFRN